MEIVLFIGLIIAIGVAVSFIQRRMRWSRLFKKYGDRRVVDGIVARRVWQGMTEDQLRDSWARQLRSTSAY